MVEYQLTRKKGLKRINLRVVSRGDVKVSAPYTTTKYEVDRFVKQNEAWIKKSLEKVPAYSFADKSMFGELLLLDDEGSGTNFQYNHEDNSLSLSLRDTGSAKGVILKFVTSKAKETLVSIVRSVAEENDLNVNKVTVKNMSSRWGSCSSKGNINLSIYVWLLPYDLRHYVISHEVAHLAHLNHSSVFWKKVEAIHPDYKQSRKRLKDYRYILGTLAK